MARGREVFLLDLADPALAGAYADWHKPGRVPHEVLADIIAAGVEVMEIYRLGDRLVMITQSAPDADPQARVASAASQAWEVQMDAFQKPLAAAPPGVKWAKAERIFSLADHAGTIEDGKTS